jgi:hypothetical protein
MMKLANHQRSLAFGELCAEAVSRLDILMTMAIHGTMNLTTEMSTQILSYIILGTKRKGTLHSE